VRHTTIQRAPEHGPLMSITSWDVADRIISLKLLTTARKCGVADVGSSSSAREAEVYPHLDHSYIIRDLEPDFESLQILETPETGRFKKSHRETEHMPVHATEEPFVYEISGEHSTCREHMQDPEEIHSSKHLFCCDICSETFSALRNLETHMCVHTRKRPFRPKCEVCGRTFAASGHLKTHMRIHTIQQPFCSSESNQYLVRHRNGKRLFSCIVCRKLYKCPRDVVRHVRIHTGERPFSCDVCDKTFNDPCSLAKHKYSHSDERPFVCEVCGKGFVCRNYLNRHSEIHNDRRQLFFCKICNKMSTTLSSLENHLRRHTTAGQRPFSCKLCHKNFSDKSHLKTHMRSHTGERPFKCQLCSKTFTMSHCLKSHMLTHTGERPFCCEVCGKKFSILESLKTHMRYHTGERPFVCELCGKKFAQLCTLTKHMRIHTGERPFECGDCRRRFARLDGLKMHMRCHTGQ